MHVTYRRAARAAARVLVAPTALAALTIVAPPAAAHPELVTSSPVKGATVAGAPPRVTLTFSDAMAQKYAKVAVTGPGGFPAAGGAAQVDGNTVTLPLDTSSPVGRYTVGYRVVSADGHPVSGSYRFTVEAGNSDGPSPSTGGAPNAPAARPTGASPAGEASGRSSGIGVSPLVGGGALVLTAAAVGGYVARRRREGHGR